MIVKPLTQEEKDFLHKHGWQFLNEEYIYLPDDWDGCMAHGIKNIRRVIEGIKIANRGKTTRLHQELP